MSSDQEAKGPWYVEERFGIFVARNMSTGEILGHSGAEETARLMCKVQNKIEQVREAAPELLAACKAAVVAFPEDDGAIMDWKDDEARRVIRQIKAAIAKADQA